MISLELNRPVPYPDLKGILDVDKLVWHIREKNVECVISPDKSTRLLRANRAKCTADDQWDDVTMLCNGLVTRENKLLARPMMRMWMLNTPGMPETMPENFPERPEVMDLPDGELGVIYPNNHGVGCMASEMSFGSRACIWGTREWQERQKNSSWPDGYTPVVVAVGPEWMRVREYKYPTLLLVALVKNEDGEELDYGSMSDWAAHNDMRVVEYWKGDLIKALETGGDERHRGVMFRWLLNGNPPLRVLVESKGYSAVQRVLGGVTPLIIWERLSTGKTLEEFTGMSDTPVAFREWCAMWESKLHRDHIETMRIAHEKFKELQLPVKPDEYTRREAAKIICANVEQSDGHLLGMLFAMLDGRDVNALAWNISRKLVLGVPGWRG